jgi:hypothetical protein
MLRLFDGDGKRAHQRLGPPGEKQREPPRERGDHEALGDHQPQQARGPRAERGANAHIPFAFHCAGEQQVRDVEARQQQDKPNQAHPQGRGRSQAAPLAVAFAEHPEARAAIAMRLGPVARHGHRGLIELPLDFGRRRRGGEAAEEEQPACLA